MTRGHGWSLTITMRGTFTPFSLPAFTGAFDLTPFHKEKSVRMEAPSPTCAMAEIYDSYDERLTEFRGSSKLQKKGSRFSLAALCCWMDRIGGLILEVVLKPQYFQSVFFPFLLSVSLLLYFWLLLSGPL